MALEFDDDTMAHLVELGWDDHFASLWATHAAAGWEAARVVKQQRGLCTVAGGAGDAVSAQVSGRFRHEAAGPGAFPAVGDWVAIDSDATIHAVLPRRSVFARKAAGDVTESQVVAANIDTVFLVTGLDDNFNLRRIERFLTAAWESGAAPVVVLNKVDLAANAQECVEQVQAVALAAPVVSTSALVDGDLEQLRPFLQPGKTVALLGSSGVGKSTLVNRLLGEERLLTGEVSGLGSRGRHTTTHRELVVLPNGTLLVDTPGMRELQLWADEDALALSFSDIDGLAAACAFGDCRHEAEPGCAVRAALDGGTLDAERFESFLKQRRELQFLELKQDSKARRQSEKQDGRRMATMLKEVKRSKPRYRT